jgi:hypothetical protein
MEDNHKKNLQVMEASTDVENGGVVKLPKFNKDTLSQLGALPKQQRILIIVAGVALLVITLLLIASFFVRKSREGGALPSASPAPVSATPTPAPQEDIPSQIRMLRESLNNLQLEDSQLQLPQVEFNIKI